MIMFNVSKKIFAVETKFIIWNRQKKKHTHVIDHNDSIRIGFIANGFPHQTSILTNAHWCAGSTKTVGTTVIANAGFKNIDINDSTTTNKDSECGLTI